MVLVTLIIILLNIWFMKQNSKLRARNLELEKDLASKNEQQHEDSSQKVGGNCSGCSLKTEANFAKSF